MTAIPAYGGADADMAGPAARSGGAGGPRRAPQEEAWKSDRALKALMARAGLRSPPPDRPTAAQARPPSGRYIEAAVLDQVLAHRSTIVFVNSRGAVREADGTAERAVRRSAAGILPGGPEGGVAAGGQDALPGGPDVSGASAPTGMRSDMGATSRFGARAPSTSSPRRTTAPSRRTRRRQVEQRAEERASCRAWWPRPAWSWASTWGPWTWCCRWRRRLRWQAGLQRIGRANHQVGGRSEGIVYPRTRTEVIDAAVVSEGMRAGAIEQTALVKNALDVLAQQTVAAVAMDDWAVGRLVRHGAPRRALRPTCRAARFEAVLDMLAGRHASADLVRLQAAHRVGPGSGQAVRPSRRTAPGGRGGRAPSPTAACSPWCCPKATAAVGRRRVGELDEEMVYESRVGDIIALGTSTWRIREITRDRVIVEPAPGRSARLPFWHGEGVGRPAETGRARGAFVRAVARGHRRRCARRRKDGRLRRRPLRAALGSRWAWTTTRSATSVGAACAEQRAATGAVPDDRTLVVERCEDETGDWRVMLHSPYGRRVHEPWAMAVADRVMRLHGFDPQASAADDGIVLRIPQTETRLPGVGAVRVRPGRARPHRARPRGRHVAVRGAVPRMRRARPAHVAHHAGQARARCGSSASRPASCWRPPGASRSSPSWLETARECLQDVYDLPALHELMEGVQTGSVRLVEAQTSIPSPFAAAAAVRLRGRPPLRRRPAPCRTPRVAALAGPGVAGRASGLGGHGRAP